MRKHEINKKKRGKQLRRKSAKSQVEKNLIGDTRAREDPRFWHKSFHC